MPNCTDASQSLDCIYQMQQGCFPTLDIIAVFDPRKLTRNALEVLLYKNVQEDCICTNHLLIEMTFKCRKYPFWHQYWLGYTRNIGHREKYTWILPTLLALGVLSPMGHKGIFCSSNEGLYLSIHLSLLALFMVLHIFCSKQAHHMVQTLRTLKIKLDCTNFNCKCA